MPVKCVVLDTMSVIRQPLPPHPWLGVNGWVCRPTLIINWPHLEGVEHSEFHSIQVGAGPDRIDLQVFGVEKKCGRKLLGIISGSCDQTCVIIQGRIVWPTLFNIYDLACSRMKCTIL